MDFTITLKPLTPGGEPEFRVVRDPRKAAEIQKKIEGNQNFYLEDEYVSWTRVLGTQKQKERIPEAMRLKASKCPHCEKGWLFQGDPDPLYLGKPLARPCPKCNLKGAQIVSEYKAYLETQDWYRSAKEDEDQRIRQQYWKDEPEPVIT